VQRTSYIFTPKKAGDGHRLRRYSNNETKIKSACVREGDYDSLLMRCTRIKPDRPGSSKFTKRWRVAGPRAARCNLMETERNTASSQLAPLPFTFGRPLSCLRRDNCQRWTCFINADTPARTRLCERGTPTVTRIRLPCNTSSPRCGS